MSMMDRHNNSPSPASPNEPTSGPAAAAAPASAQTAAPTLESSVPDVVQLATMDDLDALSAELDAIDLTLADLDAPAVQANTHPTGQSSPSSL